MPVAHLFNYVDGFTVPAPLQPHEIVYIGLRSIDTAEQIRLDEIAAQGGLIFHASEVLKRGMASILNEITAAWSECRGPDGRFDFPIHISLDVDSMDPRFTPATGTPVPGGISPADVSALVSWANAHAENGLTHLDVVEVNCYLSTPAGVCKTLSAVQQVVRTWLSTHAVLHVTAAATAVVDAEAVDDTRTVCHLYSDGGRVDSSSDLQSKSQSYPHPARNALKRLRGEGSSGEDSESEPMDGASAVDVATAEETNEAVTVAFGIGPA
jgi:hypothetical protein